jgi:hypothetical protein
MYSKALLAAAAVATATAAQPVATAQASPGFSFSIEVPNGSFSFGGDDHSPLTCSEARRYLRHHFDNVHRIECNGKVYTFRVKNPFGWGTRKVKIDKWSGDYWFA